MDNVQLQLQTGFIDRLADNEVVTQRVTDGYFNATAMCRASGKKVYDYSRLSATQEFIKELSSEAGIPASGKIPNAWDFGQQKTAPGAANTESGYRGQ